jgi:hypothetical protein
MQRFYWPLRRSAPKMGFQNGALASKALLQCQCAGLPKLSRMDLARAFLRSGALKKTDYGA